MTEVERVARDLQGQVGTARSLVVRPVETGAIRGFLDAAGDDNPLYRDSEYARGTRWGGLVAPPTFVGTIRGDASMADIPFGSSVLNGGEAYEFFRPVRPGDLITAAEILEGIKGVVGKSGELLVLTSRTDYVNQEGNLVARRRGTAIKR